MAARCRWCDRFLGPAGPAAGRGLCPPCLRLLRAALAERPPPAPKGDPLKEKKRRRP
jgi:hypothetical protein